MRLCPILLGFLCAAGVAQAGVHVSRRASMPQRRPAIVDLGKIAGFKLRADTSGSERLRAVEFDETDGPGMAIVPSLTVGPVHAFIGGHMRSESLQPDPVDAWGTSDPHAGGPGPDLEFEARGPWGGQFAASATGRNVALSFTLHTR